MSSRTANPRYFTVKNKINNHNNKTTTTGRAGGSRRREGGRLRARDSPANRGRAERGGDAKAAEGARDFRHRERQDRQTRAEGIAGSADRSVD